MTQANEKYIGDTLAQKTYTTDTFPFERRDNRGERDQYYIKNTHPAIIPRDVFEKAQALLALKAGTASMVEGVSKAAATDGHPAPPARERHPLSKMLVCGACGTAFKRRGRKSGFVSWVCCRHDRQKDACVVESVAEAAIHDAFIRMVNKLRAHRGAVLEPALAQLEALRQAARAQNGRLAEVRAKLAALAGQAHRLNALRTDGLLDNETWQAKANAITMERAELQKEQFILTRGDGQAEQMDALRGLLATLESMEQPLAAFDATLFAELVERVTIHSAERITVRFAGGIELMETMGRLG